MPKAERAVEGRRGGRKKKLTGEEKLWFRIAERIGCSVQRARAETTATEFLRWQRHLEEEWDEKSRLEYVMARVAYEVWCLPFRVWGKEPPEKELEDFLPKFTITNGPQKTSTTSTLPATRTDDDTDEDDKVHTQAYSNQQKAAWLACLGGEFKTGTKEDSAKRMAEAQQRLAQKKLLKKERKTTLQEKTSSNRVIRPTVKGE